MLATLLLGQERLVHSHRPNGAISDKGACWPSQGQRLGNLTIGQRTIVHRSRHAGGLIGAG